jgi:hypothetical protein
MPEQPSSPSGSEKPAKKPYGPGILMIIGFALLVGAGYVICALYLLGEAETFREENAEWKIYFNWAAAIAALIGAVYAFALAAKRSKGGTDGAAGAAPPPPAPPAAPEAPADESAPAPEAEETTDET